jgi:hypothetical protein
MIREFLFDDLNAICLIISSICLFVLYFNLFFHKRRRKIWWLAGILIFSGWQGWITYGYFYEPYINLLLTCVFTLFAVICIYEGAIWQKCLFAIHFNALWMLMEIFCHYFLQMYLSGYVDNQVIGSVVSKLFYFILLLGLHVVFRATTLGELPTKQTIILILIPTGNIYIMNYIFKLGSEVDGTYTGSSIAAVLVLFINLLVFYFFIELTKDFQLRRINAIYEQQLDMYEQHQKEREVSDRRLRELRHNMKNMCITIATYAKEEKHTEVLAFVNQMMEECEVDKKKSTYRKFIDGLASRILGFQGGTREYSSAYGVSDTDIFTIS